MKIKTDELLVIREALEAGIELRQEAFKILKAEKNIPEGRKIVCLQVDNEIIEKMQKVLNRVDKAVSSQR